MYGDFSATSFFKNTGTWQMALLKALIWRDEVLLLPIYPARELPIEGVSSDTILSRMKNNNKRIVSKEEIAAVYKRKICDLVCSDANLQKY